MKQSKYYVNTLLISFSYLFWFLEFLIQKNEKIHFSSTITTIGTNFEPAIIYGAVLFFMMTIYVSLPITLCQFLYGVFKIYKKDVYIGMRNIYGATSAIVAYLIIFFLGWCGVWIEWGP